MKKLFLFASLSILIFISLVFGLYFYYSRNLPDINFLMQYEGQKPSKVYSSDGVLLTTYSYKNRVTVPFCKIPKKVVLAFLAAEDARFFKHPGIDIKAILRAIIIDISKRRVVEGGSTITQQLARSFFLSHKKTIARKIKEMILAFRIERHFSKKEILSLYLNHIYFGAGAYGIEAASNLYFGKHVWDLNLAEAALLAALPKGPSRYCPYNNFKLAKRRQLYVLDRMYRLGYITKREKEEAEKFGIKLKYRRFGFQNSLAPFFTEFVRQYLIKKYGEKMLYQGGLSIYTTLDSTLQSFAENALDEGLRELDKREGFRGPKRRLNIQQVKRYLENQAEIFKDNPLRIGELYNGIVTQVENGDVFVRLGNSLGVIKRKNLTWVKEDDICSLFHFGDLLEVRVRGIDTKRRIYELSLEQEPEVEGAFLAMDPNTGFVKALLGGRDYRKSQFNRAIFSKRQPGSAFKPIIYAAALEKGYNPASIIMDLPVKYEFKGKIWIPRNYDEKFWGPTTLRSGLVYSRNVITVKLLKKIGLRYLKRFAKRLGIESKIESNLTVALGTSSVSLLELVKAYSVFANGGYRIKPVFVRKVLDSHGNVLEENFPERERAISPQTAYIMTSLLEAVIQEGTGWRAKVLKEKALAGKTGTTNNYIDAWFIGYTPSLCAGVWVGYDARKSLGDEETGSRAASPIWIYFMKMALSHIPKSDFKIPEGIIFCPIDPKTGFPQKPSKDVSYQPFFGESCPSWKEYPEISVPENIDLEERSINE